MASPAIGKAAREQDDTANELAQTPDRTSVNARVMFGVMARPLRIEFPGGLYHVTSRGDGREDVYFCDRDRLAWLDLFGQVCRRFNWSCYAWCQMTNHFHVVVETADGHLARGMRHLNGVYTQYINRAHARVGHVFQGRYHAILVDRDSYLLELSRYVVLNPVRAALVQAAVDWR